MSARRRCFNALVFASLSFIASGCGLGSCVQEAINPTGTSTGAVLNAPKSARAGDTITLDATGSEVYPGVGEALCPDIVRFYLGPPGTFTNKKVDPQPVKVISKPKTNRVAQGTAESHCRLVDGAVRVKVPPAPQAGVSNFEVGVIVQADSDADQDQGGGSIVSAPFHTVASATISVDTPKGGEAPPPAPAANQAPVARFFAEVDPAVQGRPINLNARESFDPDGTIAKYEFDYNGDGTYELSSIGTRGHVPDAGAPGTRRIIVRVTDDKGATAVSAPLDLPVVASTTFTEGTFGFPAEVAVNTPYDVTVDNNVAGADVVALDTDNDGEFDDGLPNRDANPADPKPQFKGMQYGTGGWKRLRVLWVDNDAPTKDTVSTDLIQVTPFVNPAARIAEARATAAPAGTRLSATLTPTGVIPVAVRRVSLVRVGVKAQGLIVRGRLRGKIRAARRGQKVPPSAKVLTNTVFAGRLDGTFPMRPDGGYGTPTGSGWLLARASRDRRTMVCLRVTQRSVKSMRFKVVGATGKARGLRASGTLPALSLTAQSLRTRSSRVAITVKTGPPRGFSKDCRALRRHLAAPGKTTAR